MTNIKALPGRVLVTDMDFGERKIGNIVLADDNRKSSGVRARWAKVYSVGKGVTEVKEGEYILVAHGRWTRGIEVPQDNPEDNFKVWQVEYPDGVLAASDKKEFDTFADESVVHAEKMSR